MKRTRPELPKSPSRFVCEINDGESLAPLLRAGYLSPQDVDFQCSSCSYYSRETSGYGYCMNRRDKRNVEALGCCSLWSRNGISNPGSF